MKDIVVSDVDDSGDVEVWVLTDESSPWPLTPLIQLLVIEDVSEARTWPSLEARTGALPSWKNGVSTGVFTPDMFLRGTSSSMASPP